MKFLYDHYHYKFSILFVYHVLKLKSNICWINEGLFTTESIPFLSISFLPASIPPKKTNVV